MKRIYFAPSAKTSASFAVSAFRLFAFIALLTTLYALPANAQYLNSTGGKIHISGGAMNVQGKMLMDTASVIENKATLKTDTLKNAGDIHLTGNDAQLVIDSGMILQKGVLQLNSNKLVLLNSDTNALQVTDGKLLLGDSLLGSVVWNISDNTGKYVVPFSDSLGDVFIELKILEAGDSLGQFTFSTYQTENDNTPLPANMGDDAARMLTETPLKITDRFWKVEAENYGSIPAGKLKVTYLASEVEGSNTITVDSLILSRWDGNCWQKLNGEIDSASSSYQSDTTERYGVLALHKKVIPTLCNDGNNCEYAYLLLETDNEDMTHEMTDTIHWFKFTAKNTVFDFSAYQFDSPDFHINKIKLFSGNCTAPNELSESIGSDSTDYMYLRYDSLEIGEKYFLAVYQEGSELSEFKVNLRFLNENYWNILYLKIADNAMLPQVTTVDSNTTVTFPDTALNNLFKEFKTDYFAPANPGAWEINDPLAESLKKSYIVGFYGNEDILQTRLSIIDTGEMYTPTTVEYVHFSYQPDDYNIIPGNSTWLDQINIEDAWEYTHGDMAIKIAIFEPVGTIVRVRVDDPDPNNPSTYQDVLGKDLFQLNHPDLAGKVELDNVNSVAQLIYNQYLNTGYTNTFIEHGTQVAGFAAATTDNGTGIASPGFDCSLGFYSWNLNYLPGAYHTDLGDFVSPAQVLLDIIRSGNKIVNISWFFGCNEYSSGKQYVLDFEDAMKIANKNDVAIVIASGNRDCDGFIIPATATNQGPYEKLGYTYPNAFDNVISVSNIDVNKLYCCFQEIIRTNFGLITKYHPYATYNDKVDLTAPGVAIKGLTLTDLDGGYGLATGTSFSSPIVAGVAGLILSINPCLAPGEVEYILKESADASVHSNVGMRDNAIFSPYAGAGLLDAYAACSLAAIYGIPADYTITTNEMWDAPVHVDEVVTVTTGNTLTIQSIVKFSEGAKLVVQRGAKLIVEENGRLTNCIDGLWEGIVVEGNSTIPQPGTINIVNAAAFTLGSSDHGVVVIKDHAVIENAEIGVRLGTGVLAYAGGILFANEAVFKNNVVAVQIDYAFPLVRNKTTVINSQFTTDAFGYMARNNIEPEAFVRIISLAGTPVFRNNTFENLATDVYAAYERGTGILSIGPFKAEGTQDATSYAVSHYQNVFKNLAYGIRLYNFGNAQTRINRNKFLNNRYDILLSNADYATVMLNDIVKPEPTSVISDPPTYAIYVQGSTGFQVEENYIEGYQNNDYGIYVDRTGDITSDDVYKNYLTNLSASLLASETNDNTQFLCNEMTDADYHIAVFEGATIALDQGNCLPNLPPTGNAFSTCNTNLTFAHIYNDNDNRVFNYWFEPGGTEVPDPDCVSPNVNPILCNVVSSSCPSKINYFINNPPVNPGVITGHTGTCIICINDNIADHRMGLHNDWENLRTMVNGYSLSASAMKDSLVNQGNRLPDEILLDAIVKKNENDNNPFFSDTRLRDILVANAPNTDKVMRSVKERIPAISGDVLPQIEAAQDSPATGRIDTMNIIYALEHEKGIIYNTFLRFALEDSNDITLEQVIDSLELETDVESRIKLVELYLAVDSLNEADEMLDSVKLYNEELRQYSKLTKLYIELRNDDKSWLDADSNMIDDLWDIVETRTNASVKAQNVLSLLLDTTFAELIEEIEEGGSHKTSKPEARQPQKEKVSALESLIKVYPNPAKDEMIIELPESDSDWQLKMTGILGNNEIQKVLEADTRKLTFSLKDFPSGIYLLSISNSKGINNNKKLVIIK